MKDNGPLLDQTADDTQCVVNGALCLLNHQLVGASHHDAHRFPRTGASCDLDKRDKNDSSVRCRLVGRKLGREEGRKESQPTAI